MNVWTDAANALAEQRTSPTQRRDLTMRPTSILDPRFRYVPSNCTDVTVTWRRFGFNPQRIAERRGELVGTASLIRSSGLQFLCEDSDRPRQRFAATPHSRVGLLPGNSTCANDLTEQRSEAQDFTSAAHRSEIAAYVRLTVLLKVLEESKIGTEMQAGFRHIFSKQPRVGQPPPTAGEARGPRSRDARHLENKNGKNSGDEIGAPAYLRSQDIAAERAGG